MPLLLAILNRPTIVAALLGAALACAAVLRGWRWPMLADIVLIALYAAWPSLVVLFVGAAVDTLRWWPTTSRELAVMVGADQSIGATRALWRLVLAGWHQESPARHERALPPLQAAMGITTKLEAPQAHARPLEPAEWFAACNEDSTAPHLGIIGPTQHGKTTFALALIGRRPGELVIVTAKNDAWAGADVIRPEMRINGGKGVIDWAPIADAINRVHVEMLRRNITNDTTAPRLTLVIDELTVILSKTSRDTRIQINDIWSMGASCGIRTIVIAQEVNAAAWGLEGRRDLLGNLLFARVSTGYRWGLGRLDPNGGLLDPQALDTDRLVALASEARLQGRGWQGVPVGGPPPATQQTTNKPQTNDAKETRIQQYMTWRRAGMKSDVARALRHAEGAGLDDVEWAEAGKRLQTLASASNC